MPNRPELRFIAGGNQIESKKLFQTLPKITEPWVVYSVRDEVRHQIAPLCSPGTTKNYANRRIVPRQKGRYDLSPVLENIAREKLILSDFDYMSTPQFARGVATSLLDFKTMSHSQGDHCVFGNSSTDFVNVAYILISSFGRIAYAFLTDSQVDSTIDEMNACSDPEVLSIFLDKLNKNLRERFRHT